MWDQDQEASHILVLVDFQCIPREYRSELRIGEVKNGTWLDVRTAAECPQEGDEPFRVWTHLQQHGLVGIIYLWETVKCFPVG